MTRDVRGREYLKIALRSALRRRGLDLVRDPYLSRLARTLDRLAVEDVLDIGANIGQFANGLRSVGYRGRIWSYEPLPDAFAHLQRLSARDPRWTAVRLAVGADPAAVTMNVSHNSYSSSVRAMTGTHLHAAPDSRVVRREQVDVTTVASVVRDHRVAPGSALLKIDTQGFETEVLDGAGSLLGEFAAVQLELSLVPLYEGQDLIDALAARLRQAGFELFGLEPGIADPDSGRLLQCDGLFVNRRLIKNGGVQ